MWWSSHAGIDHKRTFPPTKGRCEEGNAQVWASTAPRASGEQPEGRGRWCKLRNKARNLLTNVWQFGHPAHTHYFGAKEQMLNFGPTLTSPKQTPCFVHLVTYLRRNLFTATCFVLRQLCCLYKCLQCTKWSQRCIASQRGAKGDEALFGKVEPAGLVGFFFFFGSCRQRFF